MKPQDILPDNINSAAIGGVQVRKGSVAAFMANLAIIEQPEDYETYQTAVQDIADLAPVMEALGVFKYFQLRSAKAISLISDIYPHLHGKIG
jgi:DNA-directed RNA polymerase subunit N (RpoN/RPB10)